jgi:hypothetical protein
MYATLTDKELTQLRIERVHILESDHARICIELAENPDDAQVTSARVEIERRIALHKEVLRASGVLRLEEIDESDSPTPETPE